MSRAHVEQVETAVLVRCLTEYRQALRLLAFCDNEQARTLRLWMRDAIAFLEDEIDRRGLPMAERPPA